MALHRRRQAESRAAGWHPLSNDPQPYYDLYGELTQVPTDPNLHPIGYETLALGIDSNMQRQRGLQPPDIFQVWDNLHRKGVQSAVIWSLEDSAANDYPIERYIQQHMS